MKMLTKSNTLTRVLAACVLASGLSVATGCGAGDDLDLSQLPIASEDAMAATTSGDLLFQWVRPSAAEIYCLRAPCPAYAIADVNLERQNLTYAIDWRALRLPTEQQTALADNAGRALLYGRYTTARAFGEKVQVFQVTRANLPVSQQSVDTPDSDRYYSVHAAAPTCQQPPCLALSANLLNKIQPEQWSGVDLTRLGLTPAAQEKLLSELQSGTAYVSAHDVSRMPVVLTEAFRPYNAASLP